MSSLPDELFSLVERKVLEARSAAEAAAEAAINALAVNRPEPFRTLSPEQRRLRNALRARARQLGGGSQVEGLKLLAEEIAYQQWHRMLFARFLAENGLLMHPTGIPVTLQDCVELAIEEGEPDAWALAARYAGAMLPGIFRPDDPVVQVRFAPEGRLTLEAILAELPSLAFTADDALGWMYQFWQSQKKDEVNASERKIGGADIAPVTQLFTEDYMVRFLLENTLGAWWAARHPGSPLVKTFTYLRFREDGTPAADNFPGWPDRAAEITVMDPCCGSGHFLVVAFLMLWLMRMEEEGLEETAAADAVLRDNIFGLEIDPRCTQIAAFALALVAWKVGGYRELPVPNVACSGIPVEGQLEGWQRLADGDYALELTLKRLYYLFCQAPELGSLIDPSDVPLQDRMFVSDYSRVQSQLVRALNREGVGNDPSIDVFGTAAIGAARAAEYLAGSYTLVATNVPYLGTGRQTESLKTFCLQQYPNSKADLATVFIERCLIFTGAGSSAAFVSPQTWHFLGSYKRLREKLLKTMSWNWVVRLGPGAFGAIGGEVVNVALAILTNSIPSASTSILALDVSQETDPSNKAAAMAKGQLRSVYQSSQLRNPDSRITLEEPSAGPRLEDFAVSLAGIQTGDYPRFVRFLWELPRIPAPWEKYLRPSADDSLDTDLSQIVLWEDGQGKLFEFVVQKLGPNGTGAWLRGERAWGRQGVAVSRMGSLKAGLYRGDKYDQALAVIVPHDESLLPAIWAFCRSPEFSRAVRQIDKKVNVTNMTMVKVPFDLEHWQAAADEAGTLPELQSNVPTQWAFAGYPASSSEPLQVAVARLLGYHWPQQKPDTLDIYADGDGIMCLPAIAGKRPATGQLRIMLTAAYGGEWSSTCQEKLLAAAGFSGKSLEDWLRDGFFAQHCRLFNNRPFIWHVSDGRHDGFSALVNYHKLDSANLEKLIYTYLGDWIRVQRNRRDAGEAGSEGRLVAALELQKKLEAIRDGEPPHDIYVRWKPLHEQPIGWNPDLDDGVRVNIRPFVTAGVLRSRFSINWNVDRGKDPDGSERLNDLHFTVAEKLAARASVPVKT